MHQGSFITAPGYFAARRRFALMGQKSDRLTVNGWRPAKDSDAPAFETDF